MSQEHFHVEGFVEQKLVHRDKTAFLSRAQMSHTGEIKNCSQAVTGVSLTLPFIAVSLFLPCMLIISVLCSFYQFFASMLTYPFVLVSNIMAVNNCG